METGIKTRYDLSPEDYWARTTRTAPDQGLETGHGTGPGVRRAVVADAAAADRQSAAAARGDAQNDLDTQNAAAAAEDLRSVRDPVSRTTSPGSWPV